MPKAKRTHKFSFSRYAPYARVATGAVRWLGSKWFKGSAPSKVSRSAVGRSTRRGRSFTTTRTMRKRVGGKSHKGIIGGTSACVKSFASHKVHPEQFKKFTNPIRLVITASASTAVATTGTEKWAVNVIGGSSSDLTSLFTNLRAIIAAQTGTSGGNAVVPATILTSDRIFVQSYYSEVRYINSSAFPCLLELFDCEVKRDTSTDAASLLGAVTTSVGANPASGFTTISQTSWGFQPNDSPEFRKFYKVLRRSKVTLVPGEVHTHFLRIKYNKFMTYAMIGDANSNYYKGYTVQVVSRVSGYPISDSTATTNVSLSAPKVDFVNQERYTYRAIPIQSEHIDYLAQLPAITLAHQTTFQEFNPAAVFTGAGQD